MPGPSRGTHQNSRGCQENVQILYLRKSLSQCYLLCGGLKFSSVAAKCGMDTATQRADDIYGRNQTKTLGVLAMAPNGGCAT